MQNYENAIQKAKRLAQTPEGQQLKKLLQQSEGTDLESALEAAASGNMSQIQNIVTQLMNNTEAIQLLKKMEW